MDGPFSCKDDDTNSSSSSGGGGGRFLGEEDDPASSLPHDQPAGAPAGAAPLYPAVTPSPDNKLNPASTAPARAAAASSSSSKRSSGGRRSVHRRVVSVPFADADGARAKGSGDCAPPSDSWAWRKYGQKPIKGSPYPRGYYRCSSSKGCPARKQVERSRVDPTMLVVTYACEHNHPWPLPKTHHHHHHQQQQQQQQAAAMSPRKQTPPQAEPPVPGSLLTSSPASADHEDSFARDLLVEGTPLAMMANDFAWFSDVSASPPPQEAFLGEPMCGGADDAAMMLVDEDAVGEGAAAGDDESSLFAGLGELPECSVVFRRGFLERQLRVQMEVEENPRRVGAAPCCGTTG